MFFLFAIQLGFVSCWRKKHQLIFHQFQSIFNLFWGSEGVTRPHEFTKATYWRNTKIDTSHPCRLQYKTKELIHPQVLNVHPLQYCHRRLITLLFLRLSLTGMLKIFLFKKWFGLYNLCIFKKKKIQITSKINVVQDSWTGTLSPKKYRIPTPEDTFQTKQCSSITLAVYIRGKLDRDLLPCLKTCAVL